MRTQVKHLIKTHIADMLKRKAANSMPNQGWMFTLVICHFLYFYFDNNVIILQLNTTIVKKKIGLHNRIIFAFYLKGSVFCFRLIIQNTTVIHPSQIPNINVS